MFAEFRPEYFSITDIHQLPAQEQQRHIEYYLETNIRELIQSRGILSDESYVFLMDSLMERGVLDAVFRDGEDALNPRDIQYLSRSEKGKELLLHFFSKIMVLFTPEQLIDLLKQQQADEQLIGTIIEKVRSLEKRNELVQEVYTEFSREPQTDILGIIVSLYEKGILTARPIFWEEHSEDLLRFSVRTGKSFSLTSLGYVYDTSQNRERLIAEIQTEKTIAKIVINNEAVSVLEVLFIAPIDQQDVPLSTGNNFENPKAELYTKDSPEPGSSFCVGGANTSEDINSLEKINSIAIDEIERVMKSRGDLDIQAGDLKFAIADSGYLGAEDSLRETLLADNETVQTLGTNHQTLAVDLFIFQRLAYLLPSGESKSHIDCVYAGVPLRIDCKLRTPSPIDSPFGDETRGRQDIIVTNKKTGKSIFFSELHPYMMYRYGFYEGKGCSYRLNPKDVFELLKTDLEEKK